MFSDMRNLRQAAMSNAKAFVGTDQPLNILGWGVSGFVLASPDLMTAIKVHHTPEAFFTELRAYRLLRQHRITKILGLTIPRLHGHDFEKRLLQIDFVSPPFLLDFAGVKFSEPGFPSLTIEQNLIDVRQKFGNNSHIAFAAQHQLRKLGIYYLDLRPSNLNVQGLVGAESTDQDDDDDDVK